MRARDFVAAGLALAFAAALPGCDVVTGAAQRAGIVPSFEQHCARSLAPTRIDVLAVPVRYDVDTGRSYAELSRMGVEAAIGERVIGLTRARIGHSATIAVRGIEDARSRKVCVRPEIRVEFSLLPMTVFVGREFRDDECRRAAILAHEEKHVAVYRGMLAEVAAEAREAITQAYGNAVLQFTARDEAQREIETALAGYLDPLLERTSSELRRRQAGVDTPAEYAEVAAACGGIALPE